MGKSQQIFKNLNSLGTNYGEFENKIKKRREIMLLENLLLQKYV